MNITGAVRESNGSYYVYYLRVEYGDDAWVVKRRYRDFQELHEKCFVRGIVTTTAQLPPKKWLNTKRVVEDRETALQGKA